MYIISKPWAKSNWSYSPETLNSGQNRWFVVPCDLEIWQMTVSRDFEIWQITSKTKTKTTQKTIGHRFYAT